MNGTFSHIKMLQKDELREHIQLFEDVFSAVNVPKVKLGMTRKKMVKYYFENLLTFTNYGYSDLLDVISQEL